MIQKLVIDMISHRHDTEACRLYHVIDMIHDSVHVIDMIQKLVVTVLILIAVGKAIASSSDAAKAGIKRASIPPTYTIFSVCNSFRRTKLSDRISKGCATLQSQYQQARIISKRWYQHARISEDMTKSVVFVASSKTLPLALAILSILPPGLGDKGLIALPCILGHFSQIV